MISFTDPLEQRLIISTNTEQEVIQACSAEFDSDYVLGVASETDRKRTFSAWVSEELDQTVVVTGCDEALIWACVDAIDVTSICSSWEEAVDCPAELAVLRCPDGACGV